MRVALPDGSTATVEPSGQGSIVARHVGDACVWGQAFRWSAYDEKGKPDPSRHDREIAAILERMSASPDDFNRWWLR